MRQFLDKLYYLGGVLGALCLICILLVIVAQMVARWTSIPFPGSTEYAGYLMAASSFLAFAYALNANAHIRVTLFFNALGRFKIWGELWCFGIGTITTTYLAYYACNLIDGSIRFNDISQGQDATPLWIVQIPVAAGAILLAICFWDNLLTVIFKRSNNILTKTSEDLGE